MNWVEGYSITRDSRVFVPASLVFIPYHFNTSAERIAYQTTNGLACHGSYVEAVLTALLEVIERDAFSITWLNQLQVPLIPPDEVVKICSSRRTFGESFFVDGLTYKAFDLTLDIPVPTSLVFLIGDSSCGSLISMGCASRPTMGESLFKAFLEAAHGRGYARFLLRANKDWKPASEFSNVDSFDKHFLLYNKLPKLRAVIRYLSADLMDAYTGKRSEEYGPPARQESRPAERLEEIVNELKALGYEVIFVDLTTDDIMDAGFKVVRVLVPGLTPLTGNHNSRFLGGNRIRAVPIKLGYRTSPARDDELFTYPHPSA